MENNKFIVINTWNGEGYSYLNGDDSQIFQTHDKAIKYAEGLFREYTSGFEIMRPITVNETFKHGIHSNNLLNLWTYEELEDDDGQIFGDGGSIQIFTITEDIACIKIETNINNVTLLTMEQYKTVLFDLISNPLLQTDEHLNKENNGDIFITAFEDYDYQFRLIKNIQHNK